MLHGPPGCAKTTLVRAAAGSVGVAFLSLSPADVYASSFVGEAEAVVRRAFSLARSAAPCILFFDEIDTIVGTSNNASGMDRGTNAEGKLFHCYHYSLLLYFVSILLTFLQSVNTHLQIFLLLLLFSCI